MRDLTPAHLRCGPRNCPSVRGTDDGKSLLIVGRIAVSHEMAGSDINRGDDEEAVIIPKDLLSGYVAEQVAAERAAWRATMRDIGPTLQRAKEEGVLDQIIEANIWPEPPCVISDAEVQQSAEVARRIRPQIEAEKRERAASDSSSVDYGELVERLRDIARHRAQTNAYGGSDPEIMSEWIAADAIASLQGEVGRLNKLQLPAGHDQPCAICGKACDALTGNPGKWPTFLHQQGIVSYYHADCLAAEVGRLRAERSNLMTQWADFPTKDGGLSIDTASAAGRLRELAGRNHDDERPVLLDIAEMLDAAGPAVQALRSEVERLRGALELILEGAKTQGAFTGMSWADVEKIARAALSQHQGEGEPA